MVYGSSFDTDGVLIEDTIGYAYQADFFFKLCLLPQPCLLFQGRCWKNEDTILYFCHCTNGFIYPIQGYWNWGGGFLKSMGYLDYAGSGTAFMVQQLH